MERRSVIRNLAIVTGGIMFLPGCKTAPGKASVALKNFQINAEQEKLLAEIAATIIPATETPGAKEVGAHLFALKMLDDMYEKDVQQNFLIGLEQLEKSTKKQFGKPFVECSAGEKQKLLIDVENRKGFAPEVFGFYEIMKQRTVDGYLNSRYVMTNVIKYEFIPSQQYDGFYRVKNA